MAEDTSFIVMKFISGQTINNIMGQKMDLLTVCRFMDQIAGALDHAHDSGIIHRDIKLANLLLQGVGFSLQTLA